MEGFKNLSYPERFRQLHLTTLETRFLRADLIEVFKIFKGFDKVYPNAFFTLNDRVSRGHDLKLYKKSSYP